MAIIIGSVFINNPPFLREGIMIAAALGSYFTTGKHAHEANHFSLGPIKEVAILIIGIFATMMPALDWLQTNASSLQQVSPGLFYWGSGALCSVLDNAPTYLCFLNAGFGRFVHADVITQVTQLVQSHGVGLLNITGAHAEEIKQTFLAMQRFHPADIAAGHASVEEVKTAFLLGDFKLSAYIVAVSVGSVFFWAKTYIGNGPNFLVKAIADHQKVHTPSFGGYILRYTVPYMLPMLLIVWFIFYPREVFRVAIVTAASAVIVMHNHPSGESTPSEADIKATRDLIRAGQLLKMEVIDHVIVGDGNFSSFRSLGYFSL